MRDFFSPEKGILETEGKLGSISKKESCSLLLISDTHGATDYIEEIITRFTPEVDGVIFSGDCGADFIQFVQKAFDKNTGDLPELFIIVQGNGDDSNYNIRNPQTGETVFISLPIVKKIKIAGINFLITHGHKHHVSYGTEDLYKIMETESCTIGIFGHTHKQYYQEQGGIILINPGSISLPRGGDEPGFALLEIKEDKKATTFYSIEHSGLGKELSFKIKARYF